MIQPWFSFVLRPCFGNPVTVNSFIIYSEAENRDSWSVDSFFVPKMGSNNPNRYIGMRRVIKRIGCGATLGRFELTFPGWDESALPDFFDKVRKTQYKDIIENYIIEPIFYFVKGYWEI